ncbi:hypothetical protein [Halovenus sp. HT40]|uniref:hypothetical protein n=1 Tax=Halovenus sp. HT40 TaxID=3126691 RepID=UPI00300EC7DE
MARTQQPPFEYSFEERENVLIMDLTDWSGETEGMNQSEADWLSRASKSQITAAVTEFSADMTLGRETQNHLAKEWSENGHEADIEKLAFVSEGLKARAVSANLDVPQEIKTFGSLDEAVEWARE